jgi:hypothetical protein
VHSSFSQLGNGGRKGHNLWKFKTKLFAIVATTALRVLVT